MTTTTNPLVKPEFPRASRYEMNWVMDNQMGPNALWLMEWLTSDLTLQPGMRVLDLGCGKALTSIFLAKEYGVRVFAADLWMSPGPNWQRARQAGVEDLVCPLKAEAHALPFAEGYFDAVLSVDAYQYFGTDELYLDYLARFVKPGGILGVAVPGLTRDIRAEVPKHLTQPQQNGKVFWEASCRCFKPEGFWQTLWQGSPLVTQVKTATLPDGWRHWRDFENALEQAGKGIFPSDAEALDQDRGDTIGFVRVQAIRTNEEGDDNYDAALGSKVGVDT